jgi:hypothetical protein
MESSGDREELYAPDKLLAHMSGQTSSNKSAQADICHALAAKQGNGSRKGGNVKVNEASTTSDTLTIADTTYYIYKGATIKFQGNQYFTHSTLIQYCVGQHESASSDMAFIDWGANGCVRGDDMLVLEGSERFVDVSGLGGYRKHHLRTVTAQALSETHKGNVIAVFHQTALLGKGKIILSCLKMEHYGADINDKSLKSPGGMQQILMDGYQIPLAFHNGLPHLKCCPPTNAEVASLTHIFMKPNVDRDPEMSFWILLSSMMPVLMKFIIAILMTMVTTIIAQLLHRLYTLNQNTLMFMSILITQTLLTTFWMHTTQNWYKLFMRLRRLKRFQLQRIMTSSNHSLPGHQPILSSVLSRVSDNLGQHCKSRFPACNVQCCNEAVATDTVFSDTPALFSGGIKAAQLFIGRKCLVADVYCVKQIRSLSIHLKTTSANGEQWTH